MGKYQPTSHIHWRLRASRILFYSCPSGSQLLLTAFELSNGYPSSLSDLSGKLSHSLYFLLDSCWNSLHCTAEILSSVQLQVVYCIFLLCENVHSQNTSNCLGDWYDGNTDKRDISHDRQHDTCGRRIHLKVIARHASVQIPRKNCGKNNF